MIDKTVLALADRVTAYVARATKAEFEVEMYKNQLTDEAKALADATDLIKKLEAEIADLEATIESTKASMMWWADRANKFEQELKKYDTDGA